MKKLYKLSQDVNNGYDTYDSIIVCAYSEQDARKIHPSRFVTHMKDDMWYGTRIDGSEYETENSFGTWVSCKDLDKVKVEFIGDADDSVEYGVVLASFNAG